MATLLPPGKAQFLSTGGVPLAGGTVTFYIPGTTSPKDTWQDAAGTVLNTNPIRLDAAGEAIIYGSGIYRQVVRDSGGNTIWDQITADTAVGGLAWGGTSTGTENAQVVSASSFSQQDGQEIAFIAGFTNTGGTTIAPGGGSGIPVLKDTASGPTALTGGEFVAGNAYNLIYELSRGAFHVVATPQSVPTTFADNVFNVYNSANNTKKLAFDASTVVGTRTYIAPNASGTLLIDTLIPVFGAVQFRRASSSVCTLFPFKGNLVSFPNAAMARIGSSGVSSTITSAYLDGVAGQTLSASTRYYAYLWNSGTALSPAYVIDWSATGHSVDANTGIEIKTGDATRVLVGMAYPQAGPVFSDSAAARLVVSWENRKPRQMQATFTADRSTSSSTFVEINTEIRCNFLSWGDALQASFAGSVSNSGGTNATTGLSIDGGISGIPTTGWGIGSTTANINASLAATLQPSEGFHYLTVVGKSAGVTSTWKGTSSVSDSFLSGLVVS